MCSSRSILKPTLKESSHMSMELTSGTARRETGLGKPPTSTKASGPGLCMFPRFTGLRYMAVLTATMVDSNIPQMEMKGGLEER